MSAQALSDRCAALGHPIDRSVIAKLEKGLRQSVTVADVLVLAKALGVPPILLIFPVGQDEVIEILPGRTIGTWTATKWFTAEGPLPTLLADGRWAVNVEPGGDFDAYQTAGLPMHLYREHDDYLNRWRDAKARAHTARRDADRADSDGERQARLQAAELAEQRAADLERELARHRSTMRRAGVEPLELTEDLRHVDEATR